MRTAVRVLALAGLVSCVWAATFVLAEPAEAPAMTGPSEEAASAQKPPAPGAEQTLAEGALPPGKPVQMVKLTFEKDEVVGRLVGEDDERIRVASISGGVIGYRKDAVRSVTRFTMELAAYYEQVGDYYHDRAVETDDAAGDWLRARRAYERALAQSTSETDRARIKAQLAGLEAEQEAWHKSAMRRQEFLKAQREAELLALEAQLTREKLDALRRQEQEIERLSGAVAQVERQMQVLQESVQRVDAQLEDMEDDIDRLEHLDSVFVTHGVFLDLKRTCVKLEQEVARLTVIVGSK